MKTFEKVGRKFNDVYTKLFAGGSARLKIVESDDPLEAGLNYLVSPPGKELQSIAVSIRREQSANRFGINFCGVFNKPAAVF